MKDLLGNDLFVGDRVIFAYYRGSGQLYIGTIISYTEKNIIIVDKYTNRRVIRKNICNLYLFKLTQ